MSEALSILEFIHGMRWQDFVDILIMAFLIYQVIRLVRGTRSMQMLVGLAVVFGAYTFSKKFDLLTLNWVLSNFLSYIILILVILFQADIRRALTQVARNPFARTSPELMSVIGEVARAAFTMAEGRVGALIAFEREIGLKNYIEAGKPIDAKVSTELLLSIFNTEGPLHDGAVIIQNGRLASAGCFLPLQADEQIKRSYGTRHRAAIGLAKETDAAVVVVSEEMGIVSLALEGRINRVPNQNKLLDRLAELLKTGTLRLAEGIESSSAA